MASLAPVLGNSSLLQLSLPGTHDTLTSDLSRHISDGAMDGHDELSEALHLLPSWLEPGGWIRTQAQTQRLKLAAQLDAGVRFLDLRQMYDGSGSYGGWRSLHFVESNQLMSEYFRELASWLRAHPGEVVVAWVTKHGSECATGQKQYPGVSTAEKRAWWNEMKHLLGEDLLLDSRVSDVATTPLATLVERGHRLVLYMGDYAEMTANDPLALDACAHITNVLGSDVGNVTKTYTKRVRAFAGMREAKAASAAAGKFLLYSQSGEPPDGTQKLLAKMQFLPWGRSKEQAACAAAFHIPGMTECPPTLWASATLMNYYVQMMLDVAVQEEYDLPNAIYLDGLDEDGTIRTAPMPVDKSPEDGTGRYGYVDAFLLVNVVQACKHRGQGDASSCAAAQLQLKARLAQHPVKLWDDAPNGRIAHGFPAGYPPASIPRGFTVVV